VLAPRNAIRLGRAIVDAPDHYTACKAVAREAVALLKEAHKAAELQIDDRELPFLDMVLTGVDSMPEGEDEFIEQMMAELDTDKFEVSGYELGDLAHS
jgi:chaperone required for assembly of F1-ATPase